MKGVHLSGDFGYTGIEALMLGMGDDSSLPPAAPAQTVATPVGGLDTKTIAIVGVIFFAFYLWKKRKK